MSVQRDLSDAEQLRLTLRLLLIQLIPEELPV